MPPTLTVEVTVEVWPAPSPVLDARELVAPPAPAASPNKTSELQPIKHDAAAKAQM
jgi:hypothetical protein